MGLLLQVSIGLGSMQAAETVDLVFYNYSLIISVPLALFTGAFTVAAPEAFEKFRNGK